MRCLVPRLPVALALLAALAGCGGRARPSGAAPAGHFLLVIDNHHWQDVRLFLDHEGSRQRIGIVTGSSSARLDLTRWLRGTRTFFTLYAVPLGSAEEATTGQINLVPGETIRWTLESQLRRSSHLIYGTTGSDTGTPRARGEPPRR